MEKKKKKKIFYLTVLPLKGKVGDKERKQVIRVKGHDQIRSMFEHGMHVDGGNEVCVCVSGTRYGRGGTKQQGHDASE